MRLDELKERVYEAVDFYRKIYCIIALLLSFLVASTPVPLGRIYQ